MGGSARQQAEPGVALHRAKRTAHWARAVARRDAHPAVRRRAGRAAMGWPKSSLVRPDVLPGDQPMTAGRHPLDAGHFPQLASFAAGYLHQEYAIEHTTPERARDAFLRAAAPDERAR